MVSGTEAAIEALARYWADAGHATSGRASATLFTPRWMEPMLAEFASIAASISTAEPKIQIVSNLTGRPVSATELADPEHWCGTRVRPCGSTRACAGSSTEA